MKNVVIQKGLFPNVTILAAPIQAATNTIVAANHIAAQRKVMRDHNTNKNTNVQTVIEQVKGAVSDYNVDLEAQRVRCHEPPEPNGN